MPFLDFPLILLTRRLGDVSLAEALLFPEILALHAKPQRLATAVRALATKLLSTSSPLDVHRRALEQTPILSRLPLTLEPPRQSVAWSQPVTLALDVVRWRHGNQPAIAYLPALGIEVLSDRDDALEALIVQHARAALARTEVATRLFDLAQFARVEAIDIERGTITADIPTPAQIAAESAKEEDAKPIIEEAGVVLDDARAAAAYEVDEVVNRVAEALVGRSPRSLLLVGPSGVGKTALFVELFRQRRGHRLASAPFWMTSGARLIAGASGYGAWQERCQKLARQARHAGAILHLGNLVELMEVGKGGGSGFGIASFFRPYLARGDFLAVVECTPEQLPLIERAHPHLLAVFQTLRIEEPLPEVGRRILGRAALAMASETEPAAPASQITDEALATLDFLHRRYATYSASPGRPLRFLRNLLRDRPASQAAVTSSDVTEAFSRETGLPRFLLDDAAPLDLEAARTQFAARVIGQPQAVERVVDVLATVKAALNRPRRPIASLLFIGPTGVGKTEMAKALADYFFGDAAGSGARVLRFDMSEFATAAAVTRLVGAAWDDQGLLTSRVREEPFCVLLLDEFEKAHPAFFDLLLQVLGEGRLTDSAGRLADFSNAIVVMTSNLGAESFGAGPFGLARGRATDHAADHFTQAVRDFLRPELFNRIDRVIPFHPLNADTVRQIASREIEQIARRDGVRQRNLRLDISPAAVGHLATTGYDALYGARPLKRRIDRDLLAPLADALNQYAPALPLTARVDVSGDQLDVTVRARAGKTETASQPESTDTIAAQATSAATLRRQVQRIARCPATLSLHNELFTLERLLQRKTAHPRNRWIDPAQRERRKRLRILADGIAQLSQSAFELEDALLLDLYEDVLLPFDTAEVLPRLHRLDESARSLLLHLFTLHQSDPHFLTLALYAGAPASLFALARAYRQAALELPPAHDPSGVEAVASWVQVTYFTRMGKSSLGRTTVAADAVEDFLSDPRPGVLGIALAIRGGFALGRFESEAGLHVIEPEKNQNPHPILIDTSSQDINAYRPPKDVEFRIALAGQRRRTYALDRNEATDPVTGKTYRFAPRALHQAIGAATEEHLVSQTQAILRD